MKHDIYDKLQIPEEDKLTPVKRLEAEYIYDFLKEIYPIPQKVASPMVVPQHT